MVFAAVVAAHHALAAHIQTLDGTGSGCGPTGNNCSGPAILHHQLWAGNKSHKYVLGDSPKQDIDQKSGASGFFEDGKQSLPADHGYMINSWRSGSAQGVAYDVPKDYVGYGHTGMHSGLFKFYGGPASGHSASSMLGRNVDGGVHVHAKHHAFGSDSSRANAMYVPSTHQAQTGFYGNQHALSWQKSITRTKALPEQFPSGRQGGPGGGPGGGSGAEARFIMGQSFSHGQNLTTATSMVKSGHASASTTVSTSFSVPV